MIAGTSAEAGVPRGDIDEVRQSERRSRSRERWVWATALVLAAGFASLVAHRFFTEAPEPRPAAHFLLDSPEGLDFWDETLEPQGFADSRRRLLQENDPSLNTLMCFEKDG